MANLQFWTISCLWDSYQVFTNPYRTLKRHYYTASRSPNYGVLLKGESNLLFVTSGAVQSHNISQRTEHRVVVSYFVDFKDERKNMTGSTCALTNQGNIADRHRTVATSFIRSTPTIDTYQQSWSSLEAGLIVLSDILSILRNRLGNISIGLFNERWCRWFSVMSSEDDVKI